ncbi:MAG: hypothetical protein K9M07_03330 [Simkaniaceae bacterium]|nr:hypothetical protein [Simkaniaceae bacterium]MCF7852256.1 hypothetical protein [Simkaniaceae bacterium]
MFSKILTFFFLFGSLSLSWANQDPFLSYSDPYYAIQDIGIKEGYHVVITSDGSCWQILKKSYDHIKSHWLPKDNIVIYPLSNDKKSDQFVLKNTRTQTMGFVKLWKTSYLHAPSTGYIVDIVNTLCGGYTVHVKWNEGTYAYYKISRSDTYRLYWWKKGDAILIGSNMTPEGQLRSPHQYIIINLNQKEHAYGSALK